MNKTLRHLFLVSIVTLALPASLHAGGIDNNNEFSASKIRTFTRAASTEADAAFYNPAGIVQLKEGLHIAASNFMVFDTYDNTLANGLQLDGSATIFAVPNASIIYNKKDWAAYFNFTIPGGGGSVNYDNGSPTSYGLADEIANGVAESIGAVSGLTITDGHATDLTHSLSAKSFYLGFTLGGAIKITDMISLSLAGRYIRASTSIVAAANMGVDGTQFAARDLVIDVKNEYEETGDGFGVIVGAHVTPFDGLDIGLRVESRTDLRLTTEQLVNDVSVTSNFLAAVSPGATDEIEAGVKEIADNNGITKRRDLPPVIGLGVNYRIIPDLRAAVAFHTYLNRMAKWQGEQEDYDNSWEAAASLEYSILESLVASAGFMYSDIGNSDTAFGMPESAEFDAYTIGMGVGYEIFDGMIVDAGYARTIYAGIDAANGMELRKSRNTAALGVRYSP